MSKFYAISCYYLFFFQFDFIIWIDYRSVASQSSSLDSDEAFPFDNKDKEPWSKLVKLSLTETVASFQVSRTNLANYQNLPSIQ